MNVQELRREGQTNVADALIRAIVAHVKAKVEPDGAEKQFAKRPDDEVSQILYRADQSLGTTTGSGWADTLAAQAVIAFVSQLGPLSAASQLFALALRIPLSRADVTKVSGVAPVAGRGSFVGEGQPIPVVQWDFSAAELTPKKLAMITVISRELAKSPNAEAEIRRLLQASAAITLDSILFDSTAGSAVRPAGLFNGVTPISSSLLGEGGAYDRDPFINDITTLLAAVAPVGGDRLALLTSPARAAQIAMRAPTFRYPVLASSAIANTRVAAVAIDALAVAADPVAEISISQSAGVHMSDDPDEIVAGTPTTADPVRSLFQTASVGIQLGIKMDWAPRAAGAVAIIDEFVW